MSAKAKKSKPINKAGCVITGANREGAPSILVPYNEGRFAINGEYYVLPKGSVDKGESVLRAAIRESSEETGINVMRLLCATQAEVTAYEADKQNFVPESVKRLQAGKTIRDMQSAGYAGVKILKADPTPYRHDYLSRAGVKHKLAMFKIEVSGIDVLANHPDLKNHERILTHDAIKDNPARPKFPKFVEWMTDGKIPATDKTPVIHLLDEGLFAELVSNYAPNGDISTRENWQAFCKNVPPQQFKNLTASFSAIKSYLKKNDWISGDTGILKFDEKDCPLFYYAEGARVVPVTEYISKIFYDLSQNADYACAFGGQCEITKHLTPERAISHSQLAAIGPFIETCDYVEGFEKAAQKNGTHTLTWRKEDCEPCQEESPTKKVRGGDVVQALINQRAGEVLQHAAQKTVSAFR